MSIERAAAPGHRRGRRPRPAASCWWRRTGASPGRSPRVSFTLVALVTVADRRVPPPWRPAAAADRRPGGGGAAGARAGASPTSPRATPALIPLIWVQALLPGAVCAVAAVRTAAARCCRGACARAWAWPDPPCRSPRHCRSTSRASSCSPVLAMLAALTAAGRAVRLHRAAAPLGHPAGGDVRHRRRDRGAAPALGGDADPAVRGAAGRHHRVLAADPLLRTRGRAGGRGVGLAVPGRAGAVRDRCSACFATAAVSPVSAVMRARAEALEDCLPAERRRPAGAERRAALAAPVRPRPRPARGGHPARAGGRAAARQGAERART